MMKLGGQGIWLSGGVITLGSADGTGLIIVMTAPPAETTDTTPTVAGYVVWPGHSVAGLNGNVAVDGGATNFPFVTDGAGAFTFDVTPALAQGAHSLTVTVAGGDPSGDVFNFSITAPDADATAYINACIAAGFTPDATFQSHVDTLIKELKEGASPPWANYDILMLNAVPNALGARDLKSPSRVWALTNSPTFTADRGYTGNGTNAYGVPNPAYNPGLGGALLTQNDIHIGVYGLTQGANGNYQWGTQFASTLRARSRADASSAVNLTTSTGLASVGASAMPNHIVGIRRDAATERIFRNGVQNATASRASAALASASWAMFRTNSADYSSAQVSILHAGRAHSDAQALQEHNAMKKFLQARGAVA